ncbi:MAG TPA: ATP-dependent helicase [Planctomycetes bacterium]|nr:ATP-dependent helicase [Planctomycetota bacterium]
MSFSVGSLVRTRGREWVVQPESGEDLLVVRPLGGTDDEVTGIYLPLEDVQPATFDLPDPRRVGDFNAARLLRDAVRLTTRAGAGPFRCFARIAVTPRPYQLVPLLMALKLDPVRVLIADDVGVGKTIEACLIARELLDRGEVTRIAVLCPPQLAEQWQQQELRAKFHIEAELVLPSTAGKLERPCKVGESVFDICPFTVVSTDFIKSDRRRNDFVRAAPELVIIDEAHTCAFGTEGRSGRHQRHELVQRLAADPRRHLILVTATPHSGKEDAFRSLLAFLGPEFADLPPDLSGDANKAHRRRLAAHFVQRRRADIRAYLDTETPFPERELREDSYKLSPEYRRLFEKVLAYAREQIQDQAGGQHRRRIRWWSVLALLRSMGSSPAAAAASLRSRARVADTESAGEADAIGSRAVLDVDLDESAEGVDIVPGSDTEDPQVPRDRRRLLGLAKEADALLGERDFKLAQAASHVKDLLSDGYSPILFCRFIPTAEYVADELRKRLPGSVVVEAVTGNLPPEEREERVAGLGRAGKRVLVCTDCLSEGINLQDSFDAVMHYDLSWNPTRHEQREGRVDRYGQKRDKVRILTYYGTDNKIDGMVLDILLRKHARIRSSLGISVPVPVDTNAVLEAIAEGLLLRGTNEFEVPDLPFFESTVNPKKNKLYRDWDDAADKEKRSRTMFAQESLKPNEVAQELEAAREAVGTEADTLRFTVDALRRHKALVVEKDGVARVDLEDMPRALRDMLGCRGERLNLRFDLPVPKGVEYCPRTHPLVERLAAYVMDTALDPKLAGAAARAGVIRTASVARRTTLLLVRFRFDMELRRKELARTELAEECRLLAFEGAPDIPEWLPAGAAEALLDAEPAANVTAGQAADYVRMVVEGYATLLPRIEKEAEERAEALTAAHRRVREASKAAGTDTVSPRLPADVLGIYVFLPGPQGGRP